MSPEKSHLFNRLRPGQRHVTEHASGDEYPEDLTLKTSEPYVVEGNYYAIADYFREQLVRDAKELAESETLPDDVRDAAIGVLLSGTLGKKLVGDDRVARNGGNEVIGRRYIAEMLTRSPESQRVAEAIVENEVCGFHATNSIALAGIVESGGLRSTRSMRAEGRFVASGEHAYQPAEGQGSISFANLAHTKEILSQYGGEAKVVRKSIEEVTKELEESIGSVAGGRELLSEREKVNLETAVADFSALKDMITNEPRSLTSVLARVRFPVAFGVSRRVIDDTPRGQLLKAASHLGEFRPAVERIELSDLPVVAVPREVVASVEELFRQFGHTDNRIVPLEALQ